jgi:diketogulonate reductase-like aldo/keto reductase
MARKLFVVIARAAMGAVFLRSGFVEANFFSRLVKFGSEKDAKPAPAGAHAARGPTAQVGSIISFSDGIPLVNLANNNKIPLIGVGVGNLEHEYVSDVAKASIQDDKKTRLIDTAHASANEALVTEGILEAVENMGLTDGRQLDVHVVTKVWYTHLGYDRTKLSVRESLLEFRSLFESEKVNLHLHVLLHWPRCTADIPWMHCEEEELQLPNHVKEAGPSPNENPDAWKESWKALEDMYLSDDYPIASIGVSNFQLHEIESMESFARIHPHILQVNMWSLLYDSHLIDYCHKRRIHVQSYNAIQGTIMNAQGAPRAYNHIQQVAADLSKAMDLPVTPGQVVLAWLVQHGVSVIPRTSRTERLDENSAVAISRIPAMTDMQVETIAHAVEAYLSGNDMAQDIHVSVTFHAVNKDIVVYWVGDEDEVRVAIVRQGETFQDTTYPNHVFRTYDAQDKDTFIDHEITANLGEHADIHVEL